MNWLREAFREHGSRPAVIEDGRTWTYRELDALADRPPPGPILATWMPPGASHAILLLQALAAGMPIAPLHFRLPIGEAIRLAASLGARQLFTADGPQAVEPISPAPETPLATLLFTSGSTGQPRCVAHTLEAHLASARASASRIPLRPGHVWHVQLPLSHVSGLAI
ncbi:MAG: AMP-binding protein, partial [Terrimicrobiaceae bacterium]|nr:AMP-binding protein [Terrimicrobiaceae bacterium]